MEIAVGTMINNDAVDLMKLIPLSHQTISRKIEDMSKDINEELSNHFNEGKSEIEKYWAIQVDESTDISNKSQLGAFLRIVLNENIETQFVSAAN